MQEFEAVEPKSKFSLTHTMEEIKKCPRRKVLKDFCFPDGIRFH